MAGDFQSMHVSRQLGVSCRPFAKILPLGVTIDRRREKGTRLVVEPASPIVAMAISYTTHFADVHERAVALAGHPQWPIQKDFHGKSR